LHLKNYDLLKNLLQLLLFPLQTSSNQISFIITDFKHEINVSFSGAVPNLFAEGKGVVAEGFLRDRNFLNAKRILAKHDENYMPPEVKEALEIK
jgi:cytochrome c-type biogenesis protein CcmE